MGKKDKKNKKKGTPFGYLLMLIGLVAVALAVTIAFGLVEPVTEIADSVGLAENGEAPASILFGMVGGGIVIFFLGLVIRPKKKKKK